MHNKGEATNLSLLKKFRLSAADNSKLNKIAEYHNIDESKVLRRLIRIEYQNIKGDNKC